MMDRELREIWLKARDLVERRQAAEAEEEGPAEAAPSPDGPPLFAEEWALLKRLAAYVPREDRVAGRFAPKAPTVRRLARIAYWDAVDKAAADVMAEWKKVGWSSARLRALLEQAAASSEYATQPAKAKIAVKVSMHVDPDLPGNAGCTGSQLLALAEFGMKYDIENQLTARMLTVERETDEDEDEVKEGE